MPKKKTGQRKKHDKMKARQKEIGLRGERKDHLNIAERCHSQSFSFTYVDIPSKAVQLHHGMR